jgi:hypothetical protein
VVSVVDSSGAIAGRTITDGAGRFTIAPSSRAAKLRVIRIGYQPRDVVLSLPRDAPIQIAMARLPATLAAMRVSGRELCPGSEDRGPAFQLWEQARAGLLAAVVARESNPAKATSMTFKRRFPPRNELVRYLETRFATGTTTRPFMASASAAEFARVGYMAEDSLGRTFFAPDADVLLDESFATSHCFHLAADDTSHRGQIGLAFTPAPGRGRDTLVDVAGVIWIDRATPALRSLEFLYTGLEPPASTWRAGGHVEFLTVPNGISFIERWSLRLVIMEVFRQPPAVAQRDAFIDRRRQDRTDVRASEIDETGGQVLVAQWPDGTVWRAPETGIAGHVVQTDAGVPVKHALVTLNGSTDTVATDTAGAFAISRMVPGRYELVATDTTIAAHIPPRRVTQVVDVPRDRVVDVRLKVPPLTDALADLCTDQRRLRNSTAIVGRISIVGGSLPPHSTVFARWQADYENISNGLGKSQPPIGVRIAEQTVKVDDSGRFIVCGVAMDRPIHLRLNNLDATRADTTFYARDDAYNPLDWRVTPP